LRCRTYCLQISEIEAQLPIDGALLTTEDLKEIDVGGYSSKLSLLYVPTRAARRPRLKCAPLHCT
jgi:hypothetical protein